MRTRICLLVFCLTSVAFGQLYPANATTRLYFPHFVDGGASTRHWQTSFVFFNPHPANTVSVSLYFYDDNGGPLPIDLGLGSQYPMTFTLPPEGSRILRSAGSPTEISGWGIAITDSPVQGTAIFRLVEGGTPKTAVSSEPTLPTPMYWSAANKWLGVALANPDPNLWTEVDVAVLDSAGTPLASSTIALAPNAHKSFNLMQLVPDLPEDFNGTLELASTETDRWFIAWTINVDLEAPSVVASLPPGKLGWPISHADRIEEVYSRIYNEAQSAAQIFGVDLSNPQLKLSISSEEQINARARSSDNTVQISLALVELVSDSPSELASIVAHEIAHHLQFRYGENLLDPTDSELDADELGIVLCLSAGYDPYAAAGALGKLSMAFKVTGLVSPTYDNLPDPLASFSARMQKMPDLLASICSSPETESYCSVIRDMFHPHFPPSAPLGRVGQPRGTIRPSGVRPGAAAQIGAK